MLLRRTGARLGRLLFGEEKYVELRGKLLDTLTYRPEMEEEYRILCETRISNRVSVKEPQVLISQIQRSGGTLMIRLFDMHPECHVRPLELHIGYPNKTTWPDPSLHDTSDAWFRILFEKNARDAFRRGVQHPSRALRERDIYPFLFLPRLQRAIFRECIAAGEITSQRDIFDCYMTSYFNAWIDNHNLYTGPKKYVVGFIPRMSMQERNLERFFSVYPDGRLISIIREPKSWYVSARRHNEREYGDIRSAIHLWTLSAEAIVKARQAYGNGVYIMSFEELLGDTEASMRALAGYLDITYLPTLLSPTINGFPTRANTSYGILDPGVAKEPLSRYKKLLTADEITYIDQQASPLYREVVEAKERT